MVWESRSHAGLELAPRAGSRTANWSTGHRKHGHHRSRFPPWELISQVFDVPLVGNAEYEGRWVDVALSSKVARRLIKAPVTVRVHKKGDTRTPTTASAESLEVIFEIDLAVERGQC